MEENWKEIGSEILYKTLRDKGECIIGTFIERTVSKRFPNQENYTLDIGEGVKISVTGSTVLKTKMKDIEPGARVKIECLGTVQSQGSNYKYIGFRVSVA